MTPIRSFEIRTQRGNRKQKIEEGPAIKWPKEKEQTMICKTWNVRLNNKNSTKNWDWTRVLRGISYLPESIMMKFVVASQGSQGSQSQRICEYNLCSSIYPYLQLKINRINLSVLLLFPIVWSSCIAICLQDAILISLR